MQVSLKKVNIKKKGWEGRKKTLSLFWMSIEQWNANMHNLK